MRETIFLLALASALSGISLRLVEPMLPQLALAFGESIPATSVVITAFSLAYGGAILVYGPLGDRFGPVRVITATLIVAAIGSAGCALAQDLDSLTALRFFTALFSSGSATLGAAYIGEKVPVADRQSVIARFLAGAILGQALGPLIGGLFTDLLGWRGTFLFQGLLLATLSAVLFLRTRSQWAGSARPNSGANPYAAQARLLALPRVRYVVASTLVEGFFFFGAYSFIGGFLKIKFDLSLTTIGAILAGYGIGGVLFTLVVQKLLDRLGQGGLLAWAGAICCGCFLLVALTPLWGITMLCTVGLGFGFYMVHNTLITKATEMTPQTRGAGVSLFSAAWLLGQALGVAAMGVLIRFFDYALPMIGFGLAFLVLSLWLRANLERLSYPGPVQG